MTTLTTRPASMAVGQSAASPWPVFWIASIAVFLVSLDSTMLFAAFGVIHDSFGGASPTDLSWVLNAYTVVYAALLIPAGGLADTHGRKRTFLFGVTLFLAASAACGLAAQRGLADRSVGGAGGGRSAAHAGIAVAGAGSISRQQAQPRGQRLGRRGGPGRSHRAQPRLVGDRGVGLVMPALSGAAVSRLPAEHHAVGSAVNQATRQIGSVIGVAVTVLLIGHPGVTRTDFVPLSIAHMGLALLTAALCLAVQTKPGRAGL